MLVGRIVIRFLSNNHRYVILNIFFMQLIKSQLLDDLVSYDNSRCDMFGRPA